MKNELKVEKLNKSWTTNERFNLNYFSSWTNNEIFNLNIFSTSKSWTKHEIQDLIIFILSGIFKVEQKIKIQKELVEVQLNFPLY